LKRIITILKTDNEKAYAEVHVAWSTIIDRALRDMGRDEFVDTILTVLKHKRDGFDDDTAFQLRMVSDHRDRLLSRTEFLEKQVRELHNMLVDKNG